MKVILEIGRTAFLAPDAASAAKVLDLLGTMEPVETDYFYSSTPGQSRMVFCASAAPAAGISGADKYQRFSSRDEFRAWAEEQEKQATPEGGAL